jgi:tetratricopeptide (TPR) repeat protein
MGKSDHQRRVSTNTPIPSAVAALPEDRRNTAPETRARYRYQDECAAIAILNHLGSEDLEGILIEHSTDLILLPVTGIPELVSIKHREASQTGEAGWSWSALKRQRVLIDLYDAWNSASRRCTLAFWTNGGFNGPTFRLWKVCTGQAQPTEDVLRSLTAQLGVSRKNVEEFLAALTMPEDPLPRRKEATDVGVRRTADLLEKHRPRSTHYAEECYRALVDRIARAGTDVPENEAVPKLTAGATLAATADRSQVRLLRRFLRTDQILQELLSVYDRQAAGSLPDVGQHGWEPDNHFIGRSDILRKMDELLQPGVPLKVAPIVIHGIPGCGKTSVAAQFAATHKAILRPIFINASSRVALVNDLAALSGHHDVSDWDAGISQLRGPVTPHLPGNSATVLIIDGVTDADTVRGIIPRNSLCRVIITSTVSYLEQGYEHIELTGWSRTESHEFISAILSEESHEDSEGLARALHDNPLALTQAVNYSRIMGRNISDYLARLAREPLMVLDRGQASGHIDSIVKTIRINISAAEERFQECTDVLYLFSYLGSSPIDESILNEDLILSFAAGPTIQLTPTKRAWWRPTGKRHNKQDDKIKYTFTERGNKLSKSLDDHEWRDKAIEALILTSLITRREEGLVVHPLIALVARKLAGDPRPWIEVGIGLFASNLESASASDFTILDPHIDHIAALGSVALDAGLDGPAVLFISQILSVRLSLLGASHRYASRTSVEFGQHAVKIAEKYLDTPWGSAHMLAEMRRSLAIALWEAGRTDDAITYLRQNTQLALEHSDDPIFVNAVLDLGLIAAEVSELELAKEILIQLDSELEHRTFNPRVQLSVAHAKARLMRRVGQINEARSLNEAALALANEMPDCPDISLRELHGDAAVFARDLGDSTAAYRHEKAALEIVRRNMRDRPDIHDVRVLISAADGAIEVNKLDEAATIIAEAERVARAEFGVDSAVYANLLGTRGRLKLIMQEYSEALNDLEHAAAGLRNGASFDQLRLAAVLVHLAQVARFLGDRQKAWSTIKEAYDIDLKVYGPDHPETRKDLEIMTSIKLIDQLTRTKKAWKGTSERG